MPEIPDHLAFRLDLLVEDWNRYDDEEDLGPLPFIMAVGDVVEAWQPHYRPDRPGREEFMQQVVGTPCSCDYCRRPDTGTGIATDA